MAGTSSNPQLAEIDQVTIWGWVHFILTQSHCLVGGLEHELTIFPNSWEDDPIWLHLTFIYFSEVNHQPVMVTQECFGKQKMNGMVSPSRVVIRTHYKKAFASAGLKPNTAWLKRCKHVFLFVWRVRSSDIIQRFKIPKSYITAVHVQGWEMSCVWWDPLFAEWTDPRINGFSGKVVSPRGHWLQMFCHDYPPVN